MMHGEDGFHWGFGFGHWSFGLLLWIVVILVIVWLLKSIFRNKD